MSERSLGWYSNLISSSSPSRQNPLKLPLPSSKASSHGMHGDKEGIAAGSISPDKPSSPDGTTASTGGPKPLSWEFPLPLPPGSLPLQRTKSDPHPPAKVAGGSHSHTPNRAFGQGVMDNLLMTLLLQMRARNTITPRFFDDPEKEQKKLPPRTDTHGEGVERDLNLL